MSNSFEKSVKGATKIKNAPPKTKYIEHILVATHSGEAGVGEVFRALQNRLRDSTWTVVFKGLITTHLMIREGAPDVTLSYLSKHRNALAISNFADAVTQGRNIRHYAQYLSERAKAYRDTQIDWVRVNESKLEGLSVDKGLLRQTETVQRQLAALLKCEVFSDESENEITITVFRLLVLDLLALFQVANQGLISVLGHFFEMSKSDAERAMDIYRTFTRQTELVVAYLSVARQHEHHTRVQVPKLKHAPTHLARQLEEYLNDPDFEINRRQFIAEQDAKGRGGGGGGTASLTKKADDIKFPEPAANNPFPKANASSSASRTQSAAQPAVSKPPEGDLIDFFDSIEQPVPVQVQQQQAQAQPSAFDSMPQQMPQQTGFQSNNPFPQQQLPQMAIQQQPTGFYQQQPQQQGLQPNFTGAGFGGFTPQPQQGFQPGALGSIPQDGVASFQPQPQQQPTQTGGLQPMPTGTNPFRQSMLMTQPTGVQSPPASMLASPTGSNSPGNRQSTNPFARPSQGQSPHTSGNNSPFQAQQTAPLQATLTGTNPFARQQPATNANAPQPSTTTLAPQPTGSTNPFRQSAFVNHNTGQGWQHNQQPMGGGLDQLPTQQVFPRPLQQTPWQQ
ncbi:ANTH domain-containing protein [Emericellopsis atlantica]|uniref:ANTH domain-containing protein n=1 Tax=Emericellopsis atlantica TaxID=2614577 RepID=A0A9P8CQ85_9HYPO|nr:ANTH domain-containing protein [Emericellopsis atlantica]KAG9254850.1 ANTH domain-containing protein [Emericellopsis atlantica]